MKIYDYKTRQRRGIFDDNFWETCKLIAETDKTVTFGDLLKINGKYYHACVGTLKEPNSREYDKLAVEEIKYNPKNTESVNDDAIKCPVCGHIDFDCYEARYGYTCPCCHTELDVEADYSVTYTATVIKTLKTCKIVNVD